MATTADFLSGIAGDKTLSEITVPGSHDAGVYTEDAKRLKAVPKMFSICQNKSLLEQCRAGSRYFDIRIGEYGGALKARHIAGKIGIGATGGSLTRMIDDLKQFVSSGSGKDEFVIARFSKSSHKQDIVDEVKQAGSGALFTGVANIAGTKLSAVRGKIIAVFEGFDDLVNPLQGIHRMAPLSAKGNQNSGLFVCGKFANSTNMVKVYSEAFRHLNEHDQHQASDHLNLTYWTQTGGWIARNSKKQAVPQMSAALQNMRYRNVPQGKSNDMEYMMAMEEVLERKLAQHGLPAYQQHAAHLSQLRSDRQNSGLVPPKLPNVVMYDFVNENSSADIIALNFPTLRVGTV